MSAGPTAAGGLSAEELELLAMLLDEAGIEASEPEAVRPRDPARRVPLTFGQRRLWFLEQLEPENRIYNDVMAMRLGGALDVRALRGAVDAIVERHEVLHTVFPEVDGEPAQVVVAGMRIPFEARDLSHLPADEVLPEVQRISDALAHAPFDLARGPLMRVLLVRLAEDDHALVIPVHHIVSDGWSMGVFFRELSTLYAAFRDGRPSPLPPLPVQYGDFAVWQEDHLAGGALERQIAYWKDRLRGVPALLELPTDRPRPAEQTYRGSSYDFMVPRELSAQVQGLAQREGATVFMFLLAALGALLARYTGEEDIVVGTPIASRTRPELENVIGLFANTLPLRVDVSGDPAFRELLARVREGTFEDYANQDLPFERLVEELRIERSLSYNPLYQVMLVLQNTPMGDPLPGLSIRPLRTTHDTAKLDLSATMVETAQGIFGGWEYSTELFDRDTIVRLTDHFVTLLRAIVEGPDRRLSELQLIAPEERTRVLRTWNESVEDVFAGVPVHEQFEAQAEHRPDAVAVSHRGERLTYAELSRRSGRLASFLRARGVGPETRVGVCVERSPEMIVALLGVLKAGGAYVPLDPQYPRERLAFLVEDSGVAVLLTQERLFAALPGSAAAQVVFLDADREAIDAAPDTAPESGVLPDNAAYLVYTSGSTGRPKGVVVPHRALAGFTGIACEAYGVGPDDAVLQFASINFDASAEEIWPALVSGARLVLRTEEMLDSAAAFLGACREWGVTVLDLPTAYWHELASEAAGGGVELPEALRLVIIGGERALPERLRDWRAAFGDRVRLVNTYGPTEATVVATLADLRAPGDEEDGAASPRHVPIGRPLRNTRAYVLDPRGEAVPIGVPGELYLGGGGVARGYLDRPELTAAAFLPDPFGPEPGARVYRTGDRVRFLPDGTLEFVGRVDQQVKVRGFRVELGEIEAALAAQPGVAEAVVAAREESPGSVRLVAYLVAEPGAELSVPGLRAALKAELPGYMVPAAFAVLDALPLTRSGKVDRRALPAPESAASAGAGAAHAAPQSDVERTIAAAWQEVLGVESVGLDDNFFDLGGHSLLLARLRSRLAGRFPREVSVVVLFRYPTVRSLAEYLSGGAAEAEAPPQRSEEEVEHRRAAMRRRRDLKKNLGG
uniref:Long-chain-fatty-acid--CoA ligase n=1 Tax=uncultured bacterium esnapd24 TaxID=1366606 RepID=S5TLN3_9BACT|nr:long-chain-fatty-acid--CoA ligase [uncultured bacterium esnapd24]